MPAFARTGTGKWHVVGPDGCRYGVQFDGDETPEETEHATDIIAYDPPSADDTPQSGSSLGSVSVSRSLGGSTFPRGRTDSQKLVLPATITDSTGLCDSCRQQLKTNQKRRATVITGLKLVTTVREPDWQAERHEYRHRCDWCRAHELETARSSALGCRICRACADLYDSAFAQPAEEHAPDRDRLPGTPTEPVDPIVFGTTLPEYDPTEQTGSNRPLLKYREKNKYAQIVCELERTGHGFAGTGIEALEELTEAYATRMSDRSDHQTDVQCSVGSTPRTVTLEGILPADSESVLRDCWTVISDPDNWIPLGWPSKGYVHRREPVPSVPGEKPVVEEFPRLERLTETDSSVMETLESATESGRYQRGKRYYERGAVTDIELLDGRLEATVQGSRPYDVQATLSDGEFETGRCSCPDDAVPCKHIVAAVLASGDVESSHSDQSVTALLEAASKRELQTLLEELADQEMTVRKQIYERLN